VVTGHPNPFSKRAWRQPSVGRSGRGSLYESDARRHEVGARRPSATCPSARAQYAWHFLRANSLQFEQGPMSGWCTARSACADDGMPAASNRSCSEPGLGNSSTLALWPIVRSSRAQTALRREHAAEGQARSAARHRSACAGRLRDLDVPTFQVAMDLRVLSVSERATH
jgi:hypothetical protein